MAGTKSDGSITIDTKLDNSGFEKGSSELKHAVKSLTDQVNTTGNSLNNSFKFDFGRPKQSVNSFSKAIKEANSEIQDLGELGKQAIEGDADALERFKSESSETAGRLEEMKAELDKFGNTEFITPEYAEASEKYGEAATQVDELSKALENAEAAFEKLTNDFGKSREYEDLEDRIELLKAYQKEYDAAVKRGDSGAAAKAFMDAGITKGSFEDNIKAAEAEMDKLWEKFENSTPYRSAQKEIDTLTEKLAQAKTNAAQYKAQMESVPQTFSGYETENYEKDQEALQKTIDKFVEYRQMVREGVGSDTAPSAEWTAWQEKWQNMTTISGLVKNAFGSAMSAIASGARTAGSAISTALMHPIQTLDRALGSIVAGAGRAVSALAQLAKSAIVKGLEQIASAAKQAASSLASMAKSSIQSGLKKLGTLITGVGSSTNKSNVSISKAIKTILRYGLGIRSLYVLFNKLRSAIKEGFSSLAQYDSSFNQTVTNFKVACAQLKNSFAAAFAPIAQIALPALTSLINGISAAIEKVGQLIAALTGQKSYKKAITSQAAVADNSSSAASAMNDENKAAKEVQKTLAGFDDVEILHDNSSDNGNSGGGGGGTGSGVSYEDVPIDSKFADLAQMIKDAWANADFTEIGRMVGEKLRDALNSIPWDKIKATLRKIAKSIATFLNGFLEVPGLFTAIGKTIAEAINSAFEFVESFASNFHWDSLGKAIKEGILGALNNLDWPLIYKTAKELGAGIGTAFETALDNEEIWTAIFTTISRGLNAIVYRADAFLRAVNWGSLAQNIATGLNKGIEAIDWDAIALLLIDAINGIFDAWYNFVTTFDFFKFGTHIGETLSKALNNINWTEGGASVAQTINGLLKALSGFIQATDWKALGQAVINIISGFFAEFDWGTVAEVLSALVIGLLNFLTGVFQTIDWKALPKQITDAISDFFTNFDWEGMASALGALLGTAVKGAIALAGSIWQMLKDAWGDMTSYFSEYINEAGGNIIAGLWNGIVNALVGVGTWVKENIFDPFIEAFKNAFGISSPSTEMATLGGYIIDGMLQGILSAFASIGEWLNTNIFTPFMNSIKRLFGLDGQESALVSVGRNLIEGLKSGLLDKMNGIGDWISSNVTEPICGFFKNLLGISSPSKVFSEYGGYLMEGLENGISEKEELPKSALSTAQANMQSAFGAAQQLTQWATVGGNIMTTGLQSGMQARMPALLSAVTKLESEMRSTFTKGYSEWAVIGKTLIQNIETSFSKNKSALISTVTQIMVALKQKIDSYKTLFNTSGKDLMENIRTGFTSKRSSLVSTANTIMTAIKTKIDGYKTQLNTLGSDLMTQMQNGMSQKSSSISNTARNIASGIYNSFSNRSWNTLGGNIGTGIYNGLVAKGSWLETLAWNTAVRMYNAACEALGIASPSKEFAWIGEMIAEGMGKGIEDSQDSAVGAVTSLADAVVQEAEDSTPVMQIDTAMTGLDSVLAAFSDKVVQSFDSMISAMEDIANGSSFTLPAVASGSVTPYASRRAAAQEEGNNLSALADMIALRDADRLTRDDLSEVLTNVLRQYLNIDFYIGDEQIARHANAGNARLERRFSAVTG